MLSCAQTTLLDGVDRALLSSKSLKRPSRFRTDPRRYAIYFGSKASFEELESVADAGSTWEFTAPIASLSSSSSESSCAAHVDGRMTPAQQIVVRYRSRSSQSSGHESGYSSPSVYSEPDSWYTAALDDPSKDLKAVYRESRYQALQDTLQEASNVATKHGFVSNDPIVCPRAGCGDLLPNLKALTYHLHIHDIHDRTIICNDCQNRFENQEALASHQCERSGRLFIRRGLLKEALVRIITILPFSF